MFVYLDFALAELYLQQCHQRFCYKAQKSCLRGVQHNEMISRAVHDVQHYSRRWYDTLLIGNLLLTLQRALLPDILESPRRVIC